MISAARILSISTLSFFLSNLGATVFTGQFINYLSNVGSTVFTGQFINYLSNIGATVFTGQFINLRKLSVRFGSNEKRYKTKKVKT